ncbi:sugar phosphate nucleotidyltransferase [Aromatoleum petrolei]|uniref:NTP transferase domain-containing protein n=1 Tax=Aromatoleum petrolei TaxID=76116 RepID=A0ABX1MGD9_9RHOO|nr:NDP-sugar synthase [Aromatoleum petrolei]NMF87008.1 NTP transferase domain-containing protein [Aromatoleum petrolei]QTQ37603.1 Putative mannose-1-phosphate guanylyltransferase [Aromatoleum petrolei]
MAKAMILAAGQGTRVRPLTKNVPKPMVPILGKPVLEYLIEHLARFGVNEIMINVAFNHHKIEDYFRDGHRWGVEIGYSYEGVRDHGEIVPKALGSAGGMRRIQDFGGFFDETTLVICGDALIDLDIRAALDEHRHKKALASVVTLEVPREQVRNYGVVVTDANGRVKSFQEKPAPAAAKSTLASTGIYIFEPEVIDLIPPGREFDIGSELFPLLVAEERPFYAQTRFFNWIDIGRLTDYWAVLQRVLRGEVAQMDMPGTEIRPGVWVGLNTSIEWDSVQVVGPVYIGSGVRIDPGVSVIGPTWIGHGSHLRAGSRVERSILFEYTRVGEGQRFSEKILSPQYCVDRSGETLYVGDDRTELRWGDARA